MSDNTIHLGSQRGLAEVQIAGETVYIERPSTLKGTRGLVAFQEIGNRVPEVIDAIGDFRTKYMRANGVAMSRAQAKAEFSPRPLVLDGEFLRDDKGEIIYGQGDLDSISEADWERSDQSLVIPGAPPDEPLLALAILPKITQDAPDQLFRLLAIFLVSNADLKAWRIDGSIDNMIERAGYQLQEDSFLDELPLIVTAIGEVMDQNLRRQFSEIGDRMGEVMAAFGLRAPQTEETPEELELEDGLHSTPETPDVEPEPTRHGSSTSSQVDTAGDQTTPSTTPSTSPSTSPTSSTEMTPPEPTSSSREEVPA